MKKITTIILAFLFGAFIAFLTTYNFQMVLDDQSREKNALQAVYELRSDLRVAFPDGINGIGKMEGWTLTQWAEAFGWKEYKGLKKYNPDCEKEYIYKKYLPLETALQKISMREYSKDYNCVKFSEDLQTELEEAGIESYMISGRDSRGGRHRWLAVSFEPITGDFSGDYKEREIIK